MWSDAAKGYDSALEDSRFCSKYLSKYYCYNKKDHCIQQALCLLKRNKRCNISYYISEDKKLRSAIVYFEIHVETKKFQISFHSFNNGLINAIGTGKPMRWKGIVGSSRKAAEDLQVILMV